MITNGIASVVVASALMSAPIQPVEDLNQILCLSEAIYFEARGEDMIGQAAVGLVIMNRVKSNRYPDTICEVVKQPLQFSYRNDTLPTITLDSFDSDDARALEYIVKLSIDITNKHVIDFTDNSKWYYSHEIVNPRWASYGQVVMVHQGHTFINNMRNR